MVWTGSTPIVETVRVIPTRFEYEWACQTGTFRIIRLQSARGDSRLIQHTLQCIATTMVYPDPMRLRAGSKS